MAKKKKNKNIVILQDVSEINDEILFEDFPFKINFQLLCKLKPNFKTEKLEIDVVDFQNIKKEGLVYIFVIEKRIFKIGHTINSIEKRIQSYNCGKTEYRISGTNSTTNYFVLQSLLKMNSIVEVYGFFPEQPKYKLFEKEFQDSFPVSKRAENIILEDYIEKFGKKPIGCTQK